MNSIKFIFILLLILPLIGATTVEKEKEMDRKTEKEIIQDLRVEEGFRTKPYRDTLNNWTAGFGHNLGGRLLTREEHDLLFPGSDGYPLSVNDMVKLLRVNPVTKEKGLVLLKNDILIAEKDSLIVYGKERWKSFPRDIKAAILDMLFNLGLKKYLKFKKHIAAMKIGDYDEGARQVINSLAALQAPSRYKKIHDRILTAEPDPSPRVKVEVGD